MSRRKKCRCYDSTNLLFLARLQAERHRLEKANQQQPELPEKVHFLHTTHVSKDANWEPVSHRSCPPTAAKLKSYASACRLAISLNLERMHAHPWGVTKWSVVCKHGSNHSVIDVDLFHGVKGSDRAKWLPESPFDLPLNSLETVSMTDAELYQWLLERNAQQYAESSDWTVAVLPINRTYSEDGSDAAVWLQEADQALFRCDVRSEREIEATPVRHVADTTSPRLYRVGLMDARGTVQPTGDPMSEAEALERLEQLANPYAVLIPTRNRSGEGVTA